MSLFQSEFNSLQSMWQHEPDALRNLRQQSFNQFKTLGLPTRKWEEWKYTNFSELSNIPFNLSQPDSLPSSIRKPIPRFEDSYRLLFINGHFQQNHESLPDEINLTSLLNAFNQDASSFKTKRNANPFHLLNTAMMNSGISINIPDDVQLDKPLHLIYATTGHAKEIMNHPRFNLRMGKNTSITFIEHFYGYSSQSYFNNIVSDFDVGSHSTLNHYYIQEEGEQGFHVSSSTYHLKNKAVLHTHYLSLGSKLQRNNIRVVHEKENGESQLRGLSLSHQRQHLDTHVVVDHGSPHCTSTQLFKNILDGTSHGVFNGKVVVHSKAQKTYADQSNKNILLSKKSLMHSNPQLEIDADDVKCSHGSTTGQIDEEALFYLRSRGIDLKTARGLIINGFANEILESITINSVKDYMESKLNSWLSHLKMDKGNP